MSLGGDALDFGDGRGSASLGGSPSLFWSLLDGGFFYPLPKIYRPPADGAKPLPGDAGGYCFRPDVILTFYHITR